MGLTRQYLRYVPSSVLGTCVCKANISFVVLHGISGRYVAVPSCENVIIWDIRKGERLMTLPGEKHEVTVLIPCPDKRHLAVGYANGGIRVFSIITGECTVNFSGHKSAIACLAYDKDGVRLASGSKDTEIVVWDIVNEAGQYRLHGHKGQITELCFLSSENVLISASKDTAIKFWDLDTQHCFYTIVSHRSEVWGFTLSKDEHRLITGSSDSEIRVWNIMYRRELGTLEPDEDGLEVKKIKEDDNDAQNDDEEVNELTILKCQKAGSMMRQGRERVLGISTNSSDRIVGVLGQKMNYLELFLLCSKDEIKKRLKKREKKERLKRASEEVEDEDGQRETKSKLEDEMKRLQPIKVNGRIIAFDFQVEKTGEDIKVTMLLSNKQMLVYSLALNPSTKTINPNLVNQLTIPGHFTDVRTLCFSSDDTSVLTASANSLTIWSRAAGQPIRTLPSEYALCSFFVPGDRHCVVGSKEGNLQVFDIGANMLMESIPAHAGGVWSACMQPDKLGFITGGADKEVKFWKFDLVSREDYSGKHLTLTHTRSLKVSDDVLCVRISPDQKFIAIALLDCNVRIFFMDSLKFFLCLYGHKLPVLTMDISYDGALIVTGSADKNIKVWGMDFGDCHKSIFAHDDNIMSLQFVPKTHLFFSCGKDMLVKQWDADNYEKIITFQGHQGAVWALTISSNGKYVVSASADKSLRLWERTQEPLILEEEQEMEREEEFEKTAATNAEFVLPGETSKEVKMVGKKTLEAVKGAEKLMEALDIYREESNKILDYEEMCKMNDASNVPAPSRHPLMIAYNTETPDRFMLAVLLQIKSSELEESLLILPYRYVTELCKVLLTFLRNGWETEITCRCLMFLMRIHHGHMVSGDDLTTTLEGLNDVTMDQVSQMRDVIGFNMAGLGAILQEVEARENVQIFKESMENVKKRKKKKAQLLKERTVALLSV